MEVPDNNTFSLQDVVDSVNPTTDDLIDCFADAVASEFDGDYEGSKNNLLNFRNYEGVLAVNSYVIRAGSTAALACAGESFVTLFQRSTSFNFNDPIYSNSAGTFFAINSYYSNSQVSKSWDSGDWIGSPFLCSQESQEP
jgi:hypothetical protein